MAIVLRLCFKWNLSWSRCTTEKVLGQKFLSHYCHVSYPKYSAHFGIHNRQDIFSFGAHQLPLLQNLSARNYYVYGFTTQESSSTKLLMQKYQLFIQTRMNKHKNTNKITKKQKDDESAEFDHDEEYSDGDEIDPEDIHFDEDASFPSTYRNMIANGKSLRLDSILKFGLALTRNQIEEYFFGRKLNLNGEAVLKRSKQVKSGDYIDVQTGCHDGVMKIKRVRIVNVKVNKKSGKTTAYIRVWRAAVDTLKE